MPAPAEKTYVITSTVDANVPAIELKAARAVHSDTTGRTSFYDAADNLVAQFLNVGFYQK